MTNFLEVQFRTLRLADVPHLGQRKRIRVNGRPETLYVRRVEAKVIKWVTGTGEIETEYEGSVQYAPNDNLFG